MIYFLVNNNYHRYDLERNKANFHDSDITVIEIPHNLDQKCEGGFYNTFRFQPKEKSSLIVYFFNYLLVARKIKKIKPTSSDILFLYTEFELMNQLVVRLFKAVGARVYLIEDGGMGTYVPFRSQFSEALTLKEHLKKIIYSMLPGLNELRFHKMNGVVFRWLPDLYFDGVCEYAPIPHRRKIPTILVRRPNIPSLQSTVKARVIFLNECIYDYYQNEDQYLSGLMVILDNLIFNFNEVYFKFHPREAPEWRANITIKVLNKYPTLKIIDNKTAFEEMVDIYRPAILASYFSSALLSLIECGIEPLYLYHLIPELREQPIFKEVTSILNQMGYKFAPSFSAINKNYQSGLIGRRYKEAITLADITYSSRE